MDHYENKIVGRGIEPVLQALLFEEGLQTIADRAAEVMGNPLWIVDMNSAYLTQVAGETDIELLLEESRLGYTKESVLEYTEAMSIREKANASENSFLFQAAGINNNVLTCPVRVANIVIAYVSVADEKRSFCDKDFATLDLIAKVISAELQKDSIFKDNKELMHSYLLLDLLKNLFVYEDYQRRAELLGYKVKKHIYLLTVELRHVESRKIILHSLQMQLQHICKNSICCQHEQHIVVLFSTNQLLDEQSTMQIKLEKLLKESNLKAALSNSFSDIRFVPRHYEKTRQVLEIGRIRYLDKYLYHYSDLVSDQVVEILRGIMASSDFAGGAVDKLAIYDKQHHTSLYNTLKSYLEHGHMVSETAKALGIHTNTVRQRLERITGIIECNPQNGYTAFEIILAMMLYERDHGVLWGLDK